MEQIFLVGCMAPLAKRRHKMCRRGVPSQGQVLRSAHRIEKVTSNQSIFHELTCNVKEMSGIIEAMNWSVGSRNFTQVSSNVRQLFRSVGELRNSGDVISVLTAAVNFLASELPDLTAHRQFRGEFEQLHVPVFVEVETGSQHSHVGELKELEPTSYHVRSEAQTDSTCRAVV